MGPYKGRGEGDNVVILKPLTLTLSPSGGEGNVFLDGHYLALLRDHDVDDAFTVGAAHLLRDGVLRQR